MCLLSHKSKQLTPVAALIAAMTEESVYVLVLDGVIPAADRKLNVGRVCTTVRIMSVGYAGHGRP